MEDVIYGHMYTHLVSHQTHVSLYTCECGDKIFVPITQNRAFVFARHTAEKLEEAGYGPLV